MRQTASPTRIATHRSTQRPASHAPKRAAHALRQSLAVLILILPFLAFAPRARAQFFNHPADLGMTFTQQRSKFVGSSSTDFFYLRGATIDYGVVLSGEAVLELDDGAKLTLRPGDTYIQNGTRHRWSNTGDVPAVIAIALIGARHAKVD